MSLRIDDSLEIPDDELRFEFSRSGGPGGQNVNKVNSKATLRWTPSTSPSLPEPVRARLLARVASRLTVEGELLISSTATRDQGRNVDDCRERLRLLIVAALHPPRPRRATRPTLASKRRRVEGKQRRGETKRGRKAPEND